jgi:choline dehydrogenase-like flavoprotein
MKEKLPGLFSCLPVEKMEFGDPFPTESHILGTTRMSIDPQGGVVDKHLIHHQYRNLFVLGSGSFTTYTPPTPRLPLSALSLYAADQAFKDMGHWTFDMRRPYHSNPSIRLTASHPMTSD